jgi:hypothetical protein
LRLEPYRSENTKGWPKSRLRDEVIHYLKTLKVRNWNPLVKDGKVCIYPVQKTKAHEGL